jgi:hypothetical protein
MIVRNIIGKISKQEVEEQNTESVENNEKERKREEERAGARHDLGELQKGEKRKRKARSDKGAVLITSRDEVALRWIGEQYAIRIDQLQVVLGRQAQARTEAEGIISEGTARRVVTRWVKAGWVERRKIFHREPDWVWLTRAGMQLAGLAYFAGQPSPVMLRHYFQVNRIRLSVEQRHGADRWVCERAIKPQRQRVQDVHYADAEVRIDEATVGLEIELTVKKAAKLAAIVAGLAREYRTVWYFVKPEVLRGVRQAIAYLPAAEQRRFRLYDIETLTEIAP